MKNRTQTPLTLVLLSICLGVAGCKSFYVTIDGYKMDRPAWEKASAQVLERASFELGCPKSDLRLTILDAQQAQARTIGVEGCDHRAVFVKAGTSWVMNSVSEPSGEDVTRSE